MDKCWPGLFQMLILMVLVYVTVYPVFQPSALSLCFVNKVQAFEFFMEMASFQADLFGGL